MTQPLYIMGCPSLLHFTEVYIFIMTYLFRIKSEKKYQIHFKSLAKKRYLIPRTNLYIKKIKVPTNVAYNCMNQNIIPRHSETSVLIQLSLLSNDINICDCFFFFIIDLPIAHIS